jgi:hypothetical protein
MPVPATEAGCNAPPAARWALAAALLDAAGEHPAAIAATATLASITPEARNTLKLDTCLSESTSDRWLGRMTEDELARVTRSDYARRHMQGVAVGPKLAMPPTARR